MKTYVYFPPLARLSGGMSVLLQITQQLGSCGFEAALVAHEDVAHAHWEKLAPELEIISWENLRLEEEDRWIVPEGWPLALKPGLEAGVACAVYVQNWAFLHGVLPGNVFWRDLAVRFISVSRPVSWYVRETEGKNAPVVPPALNPVFAQCVKLSKSRHNSPVIAWMPRKNRALAKQIRLMFEAVCRTRNLPQPCWLEISGLDQGEVADKLCDADIFLATGFPEGFGLPPLEAMACGCLCVGFTGMGGWEYMRQGWGRGCAPIFDLSKKPWGANGLYVSDGDIAGVAMALIEALEIWLENGARLEAMLTSARETAAFYNAENQKKALRQLWLDEKFWKN